MSRQGGALVLRRGRVVEAGPADGGEQRLEVQRDDGTRRGAVVDLGLHGPAQVGDDVVVNTQAVDLDLGSGGVDVLHVNLSSGLAGTGVDGAHVMKLNYTSLQHAVLPVEREDVSLPLAGAAGVFGLHGQLAPMAWAFAEAGRRAGRPEPLRLGYVQTAGGALPGGHSRVVRELRERGLLAGHITAGPAFGGEGEAITTPGAIHHGIADRGWDAVVCGPGPGILGSASALGHGGMIALDSAHAAAALGCPVVLCARMSESDGRRRHSLSDRRNRRDDDRLRRASRQNAQGNGQQKSASDHRLNSPVKRLSVKLAPFAVETVVKPIQLSTGV